MRRKAPCRPRSRAFQQTLEPAIHARPTTLAAAWQCLDALTTSAESGVRGLAANVGSEVHRWAQALAQQCQDALEELLFFAPWLAAEIPPNPPLKKGVAKPGGFHRHPHSEMGGRGDFHDPHATPVGPA